MNRRKSIFISLIVSLFFTASIASIDKDQNAIFVVSKNVDTEKNVIVGGNSIGVSLSTDGVLVVNTSEVDAENKKLSPAKEAGLKSGDFIKSYNQKDIKTVDDLVSAIFESGGKDSTITFCRNGKTISVLLEPALSVSDGKFKIGAWVKDGAAGIGTLTFYDPETKTFAALGHGICDSETMNLLEISDGSLLSSSIVSVKKASDGAPGELNGIIKEDSAVLGTINKNCSAGIYGKTAENFSLDNSLIPVAMRDNIKIGEAKILSNISGNKVEEFDIEITRLLPKSISSQKDFVIKVTDQNLLSKTGGIVQGMSGSPIIQEGKLIGAVTHVFVNDPTRGYGIFIGDMLKEAEKTE